MSEVPRNEITEATPLDHRRKVRRDRIPAGVYFYFSEDPRSLCLAIESDSQACAIIRNYLERQDILFYLHQETMTVGYNFPDSLVIPTSI